MGKGDPDGGRPRIEISDEDFAKLTNMVRIQCTAEECALVLGLSPDTLDRRLKERGYEGFAEFYKAHTAEGRASLRRMQWRAAENGNTGMLVWLGKQMLGQRDKTEHTGKDGGPIKTEQALFDARQLSTEALREVTQAYRDAAVEE